MFDEISTTVWRNRTIWILAALLFLSACGGGGGSSNRAAAPAPPLAATPQPNANSSAPVVKTLPATPGATYADVLQECVYKGDNTQVCNLGKLPFLGQQTSNPTIDDVMARTLVSHPWMGTNFRTILERLPADVLPLFRSLTAVVIASDVRPAHYDPATGAIYLDADFVWFSPIEQADVATDPDPRANFSNELAIRLPWRYVKDGRRLSVRVNPDNTREVDDVVVILGFLLYHELAHAVDFVAPRRFPTLTSDQTAQQVANVRSEHLSFNFRNSMPLNSTLMTSLAAVSFLGNTANNSQKALTPNDLISEFANDGAIQYYAYTSQFEDFATLFETAMMRYHFGYDKDTGVTDAPASGFSGDGVVFWGQRGRIGEQQVLSRARNVATTMYPGDLAALENFLNGLSMATPMRIGDTWDANLSLGSDPAPQAAINHNPSKQTHDYLLERITIQ